MSGRRTVPPLRSALRRLLAMFRIGLVALTAAASLMGLSTGTAQVVAPSPAPVAAGSPTWPSDTKLSGRDFLTPDLRRLDADRNTSPVGLWIARGSEAWTRPSSAGSCQSCHGPVDDAAAPRSVARAAARFPRLAADGRTLLSLEDQIRQCRARSGGSTAPADDDEVLALSALLHATAHGTPIAMTPPAEAEARTVWQARLARGADAWAQRVGRLNLACMHCHDQNVGRTFRGDVASPGHPTGFPVYRMRWQSLGSMDRRIRACFSGVQAQMPPPGDALLRDLELFLKVRANGMPLEGPSIRR